MTENWWLVTAVAGLLVATFGGTPVVRGLFRLVDWQAGREAARRAQREEPPWVDLGLVRAEQGLPGGRWIGLLERAATYGCLVSGVPTGVAVITVVKGFGRYPELRSPDAATGERFIIGTLASLIWAGLWAGVVQWLRP